MTLPRTISTLEVSKFCETTGGEVAVRVCQPDASDIIISGLTIAGKITEVTIDDSTWTNVTPTPIASRNTLSIQNQSAFEIKINYNPLTVGYVGTKISVDGERHYLNRSIPIYAKAESGAGTIIILIEELA